MRLAGGIFSRPLLNPTRLKFVIAQLAESFQVSYHLLPLTSYYWRSIFLPSRSLFPIRLPFISCELYVYPYKHFHLRTLALNLVRKCLKCHSWRFYCLQQDLLPTSAPREQLILCPRLPPCEPPHLPSFYLHRRLFSLLLHWSWVCQVLSWLPSLHTDIQVRTEGSVPWMHFWPRRNRSFYHLRCMVYICFTFFLCRPALC